MSRQAILLMVVLLFAPILGCSEGNSAPDHDELSDYLSEHGDQSTSGEELVETDGS